MSEKVNVEKMVIDGKTYVPEESVQPIDGDVKIVILQRGWCFVGYLERNGDDCKLTKANVIRRWGTTKGLGELALNGPLSNTCLLYTSDAADE